MAKSNRKTGVTKKALKALKTAVDEAGGPGALGQDLGVAGNRVSNWLNRGVPAEYAVDVCRAVDWAVHPHDICPRVFPPGIAEEWIEE